MIKRKKRIITNKNLNGEKVNILFRRLLDWTWEMEYLLSGRMIVDIGEKINPVSGLLILP